MSSAFDSEVYAERQRLHGLSINPNHLMFTAIWVGDREDPPAALPVSLTVEYRPDVDTSQWWTLRWGKDQFASAKSMQLCLFRAAVLMRRGDERAKKYAGLASQPPSEIDPTDPAPPTPPGGP